MEETQQSSDGSADDGDEAQTPSNEFAAMPAAGSSATAVSPDGSDTAPAAADPNDNGDTGPDMTTASSDNGDTTPAVTTDPNGNGDVVPTVTTDPNDSSDVVPTVITDPNDSSDVVPAVTTDPSDNGDTAPTVTAINICDNGAGDSALTIGSSDGGDGNTVVTTNPSEDSNVIPTGAFMTAFGADSGISGSNDILGATDGNLTDNGQTDPATMPATDGTGPEEGGDVDPVSDPDAEENTSFWDLGDDEYILVDHDGMEELESEGNITVYVAGLNHISSISGNGTATVYGTGILLIDYFDNDIDLVIEPLEGMGYEEILNDETVGADGVGAAVFIWDEGSESYVLSNQGIFGILDEDYYLDKDHLQNALGYRFVIPADEALLLCGTGAEAIEDEEGNVTVNYYHGTHHDYKLSNWSNWDNVYEHAGTLTIGEGVELVVDVNESTHRSGAIILQNLKSLGGTDSHDGCRHPSLVVTDGGTLTLEESGLGGAVFGLGWGQDYNNRAGTITIEPGAKLRGDGHIEVSTIVFSDPEAVTDCEIMLVADHFYLNGSGTYTGLNIKNSTVHLEKGHAEVSNLTAAFCVIILRGDPNGETINIASVIDGTDISLRVYDSRYPVTITGNIQRSGVIKLDWGIFILAKGLTLDETSIDEMSGAIVYNYTGTSEEVILEENLALLHIVPDKDKMPPVHNSGDTIPVSGVYLDEHYGKSNMSSTIEIKDTGTNTSITVGYDSSLELTIPMSDGDGGGLLEIIDAYKSELGVGTGEDGILPYVQVLRMDANDNISFTEYQVRNGEVFRIVNYNTGERVQINEDGMDGVIAIRVVLRGATATVEPESPATRTNTTFTGSGILGNKGNNSSSNSDNGNGNGDNGNGNGDNGNGNGDNGNGNGDNGNGNGDNGNGNGDNGNGNGGNMGDTSNDSTETATIHTGENTNSSFWVEQITVGEQYVLHATEGEKTFNEVGGHVKVVIPWELSPMGAGQKVYAVFRDANNTLKAFRVSYSRLKSEMSFVTDCLGEFILVEFDFEGVEFSPEFYEALEKIVEI
ncbi:MAG: hypothetical protein II000_01615 [Clostridia bacterium]|nr:hypothetical protein [Clostridia bacterium]